MNGGRFAPSMGRRKRTGAIFQAVCLASITFSIVVLAILLADIVADGAKWLSVPT